MVAKHPHSRRPSTTGSIVPEKTDRNTKRRPSIYSRLSDGPSTSLAPSLGVETNPTLVPLSGSRRTHSFSTTQDNAQSSERFRPSVPGPGTVTGTGIGAVPVIVPVTGTGTGTVTGTGTGTGIVPGNGNGNINVNVNVNGNGNGNGSGSAPTLRSASTTSSAPRLSIADRFMSNNYSQPKNVSPSSSASTVRSVEQDIPRPVIVSIPDQVKSSTDTGKLSVADRFMSSASSMHSNDTLSLPMRERSASNFSGRTLLNPSSLALVPGPKRLTIADTFMRNNHLLNLDLSIASPSSTVKGRSSSRPWGSQETLVQSDRKKPIYAKFTDPGKHPTHSIKESSEYCPTSRSYSLDEYIVERHDDRDYDHQTSLEEDRPLTEDASSVLTLKNHDDKEDHYADDPVAMEAAHPKKCTRETHREPRTPSAEPLETPSSQSPLPPPPPPPRGFWIGCCFFSCGQRPSQSTLSRQQQQRREKEGEERQAKANSNCGRRSWVICTFFTVIMAAVISYLLWPRTPLMRIEGASLTSAAKITQTRQGIMIGNAAFETEWLVNVTVDNRQNRIPTRLVAIQVIAKDALTGLLIGKGLHNNDPSPEVIVLPPRAISTIQLPIRVDYQARDASDTTFVDLSKACTPQPATANLTQGQRESLQLHFWITLHLFGLDWLGYKPTVIATPATGGFACPTS
ncbi:hypothetical protein J3Q64DRAFT_1672356 [Phycomyces blakesleeanus]|uniref:Late embryogenesis abundant protein LEA-2 subgroup domain-containing protein n=1 Tax=Phycomyces blakesleeanus TaxID=4837 RepID=A0ABR3B8R9_PHYBL